MSEPPLTLKERVNQTIRDCIVSAKTMSATEFAGCYDEEINTFYLSWSEWIESGNAILAQSAERGVWFSPYDQFCPFCELGQVDVRFDEMYEKLSSLMQRLMTNALQEATCLEQAILDTWLQYMIDICPQIVNASPSMRSRSAGCRFDRPSITTNTLIDHFVCHLMKPHNILLPYVLEDAQKQWAARVPDNVFSGNAPVTDIVRALNSIPSQEVASVKKRVN
jgi:hypothetical protein